MDIRGQKGETMDLELTYLLNSGFIVREGGLLLVFDDFRDPTGAVEKELARGFEHLYIFASHAHFDHFDAHIADYAKEANRYVLGYDIRRTKRAKRAKSLPAEKVTYLETYDSWEDAHIAVSSFDSTDTGVSFLVEGKETGRRIFHAGDFNWWDWEGDTAENRKLAENAFRKQMKRLAGLSADVAFFPVDGRLGSAMDKGAKAFCAETEVRALVTMHAVGYPAWAPPAGFFEAGRELPVWSPRTEGERRTLSEKGFLS